MDGNDEVPKPVIVLAEDQSAGKSSTLEAIVGVKLFRRQNTTARVPLILSLQTDAGAPTHARISNEAKMKDAKKLDLADIGPEIEAVTATLAGGGRSVRATPVYLWIVRRSGPTLTLIDLPGITHNSGDKTQDIYAETTSLVETYIENEHMVILTVIEAMSDFHNSKAIELATKYDPEGRRTLGVVTKVDHVQTGCGIKAKLRMDADHLQLQLGFIGVINRSPVEIENDTPAEVVRAREKQFFETNPEVAGLEKTFWGTDTLVERISGLQAERVQALATKKGAEESKDESASAGPASTASTSLAAAASVLPRDEPPQHLCPITICPMEDPAVASDGYTYEREAIELWLSNHDTSPITGKVLDTKILYKNWSLVSPT